MMDVLFQDPTEAKKIGIKMGEPYFKVKELVKKNNVYIFSLIMHYMEIFLEE